MNNIQLFNNPEFGQIRTITDNDGIYFVGKDVAEILGYANASKALADHVDPEDKLNNVSLLSLGQRDGIYFVGKDVAETLGYANASKALADHVDPEDKLNNETLLSLGQRGGWLINESGLYSLVLSSKLPSAKRFKRWVTSEVLPALRRQGGYMLANANETPEQIMARALKIADEALKRKDAIIEEMKPKALFADAVGASDNTCLVGELAKMLRQNGVDVGANRLFERLRNEGFLGKYGSNYNVPTQRSMELGLFRIKETAIQHSDGHVTLQRTPKCTGKGQRYFIKRYAQA